MVWQRWASRGVGPLPVILAGPILRRTMPNAVTVWVALKAACTVRLDVTGGNVAVSGTASTIRLAPNLHVATVTATAASPLPRDRVYQYDLNLSGGASGSLQTPGILSNGGIGPSSVGPNGSGLPSFALPPVNVEQLRIFHASCRKMHGGGRDPSQAFDTVIGATAQSHQNRPHMLFLTGDQIYADDVADRMLVMIQDAADALGFPLENPPLPQGMSNLPTAGRRGDLMTQVGITSGATHAKSHLVLFSEFACMYLFAWSDVFWQGDELPAFADVYDTAEFTDTETSHFASEGTKMLLFRRDVAAMRRVLANVPTYMIFDDHEITDDWFLDRQWVDTASQDTLARRLVRNGLAAYAVFQGWGNDPGELQATKGGSTLIASLETWAATPNATAPSENVEARLGLPIGLTNDQAYLRNGNAVNWHYGYVDPALPFRVAVLDTRTRRQYGPLAHEAPGLIAPAELAGQLAAIATTQADGEELILIVSPSPLIGYPVVEKAQGVTTMVSKYFGDPEFWPRRPTTFHRFLAAVAAPHADALRRVVVLSGDVHYAFTSVLRYRATKPLGSTATAPADASFVQVTCSSQKNQEVKTLGLHHANAWPIAMSTYGYNNSGGGRVRIGKVGVSPATIDIKKAGSPIIYDAFDQIFTPFDPAVPPPEPDDRVPDWSTKTTFERTTVNRVAPPPPSVPAGAVDLQSHLAVMGAHYTYQTLVGGGTILVGRTNVGQLTFTWGSGNNKHVRHELYWFQGASGVAAVLTAFTAHLDLS